MHKPYQFCLSVIAISCLSLPYANASSNFTILPAANHTLPTTISPGQTVSAYYTVLNNTGSTRSGYLVTGLPSSISQNTTGSGSCGNPVTLAAYGNCTLQLDIRSPIQSNFALCKGTSCTASMVPLNIVKQSAQGEKLRVAVGSYEQTNGGVFPLVYTSTDSGLTWNLNTTELPLPVNAATGSEAEVVLSSVACDKATKLRCTAVGTYLTNKAPGQTLPLTYTSLNGGNSWSLGTNINPPPNSDTSKALTLISVSCDSAKLNCSAVGKYTNYNDDTLPLNYVSINGGNSWTFTGGQMSLPADAQTAPANAELYSVYCSGLQCRAVGNYTNTSGGVAALIYTSANAGLTWTVRSAPTPSDSLQGSDMRIRTVGVACDNTSGLHCTAVGQYKTATGDIPLVYTTINGGISWTANTSPLPLPADYSANNGEIPTLFGVTCNNSGLKCTTVGGYRTTQNTGSTLSYTSINGGTSWALGTVLPSPGLLTGVVCDSETKLICSAVGSGAKQLPVVYKSSNGGSTWSIITIALPPLMGTPGYLFSVK